MMDSTPPALGKKQQKNVFNYIKDFCFPKFICAFMHYK